MAIVVNETQRVEADPDVPLREQLLGPVVILKLDHRAVELLLFPEAAREGGVGIPEVRIADLRARAQAGEDVQVALVQEP